MQFDYWPLFVIFAIAWIVPMILSALSISRVPSVIIEIVMGVIIGPHVLAIVTGNEQYLNFLSDTGFLLLIFLSGLALDIDQIRSSFPRKGFKVSQALNNTFVAACAIYFGSILISYPIVELINLKYDIDEVFLIILLPSVALSIVVPVIKHDGEINEKYGQILLQVGAIATIMTILLIAIYSGILKNGFEFELLLFLLIFVLFYAAYQIGRRLIRVNSFRKILYQLDHAASQIRIRGSVAIMFLFVAVAVSINTEPVLGAFFAGTLLSIFLSKKRSSLIFKLDGMSYGFFIPIFFIVVGVNLDLESLKDFGKSAVFIMILLSALYFIQIIPTLIITKYFGFRKTLAGGILLTSRMGMAIAMGQIGLSLNLIDTAANTAIVVTAIITSMLSPLLYSGMKEDSDHHYSIYIIGGGIIGSHLADRLKIHSVSHLVIDIDAGKCDELNHRGIETMNADATSIKTYEKLNLRSQDTFVLLTESDERNAQIARLIEDEMRHKKVITITFDPEYFTSHMNLEDIELIGVQEVMAAQLENEILRPTTLHTLTDSFGDYVVEEIKVTKKAINRKHVKDIPFPPSGSLIVMRRDREVFIPHGDTLLLIGDIVTVIGNTKALEEFRRLLE